MINFKIKPGLGFKSMKQRQGDFPVFYVYGLDNDGRHHIIGSNTYTGGHPWVLKKARVSITRFWDASTFYATFQASIPNWDSPIPPLPKIKDRTIQAEDDIEIWAGYTNEVQTTTDFFDRIFIGSIDIFNIVGSDRGGVTFSIQGRDRMKWLMDSTISYNAVRDANNPRAISNENLRAGKEEGIVPRSDVILEVAQRGLGYVPTIDTKVKRGIVEGDVYDVSKSNENKVDKPSYHYTDQVSDDNINLSNIYRAPLRTAADDGSSLDFGGGRVEQVTSKNPSFHMYVTKPGFSAVDEAIGGIGIQIVDETPIDYIKFLAQQEIYPTELFQDHKNGCIYYTPRLNDLTGLEGAKQRLNRTYYYKPNSLYAQGILTESELDLRQQVITLKEERSTLSTRTNYIVGNASAGNGRNEVMINFRSLPAEWRGKDYPARFMQINDENIDTPFEAAAVAAAKARIFSRDTRSGMMVVQGDPTLSPGECVQVIGSLLTQNYKKEDYEADLKNFKVAQDVLNKSINRLQKEVYDGRTEEQQERAGNSSSSPDAFRDYPNAPRSADQSLGGSEPLREYPNAPRSGDSDLFVDPVDNGSNSSGESDNVGLVDEPPDYRGADLSTGLESGSESGSEPPPDRSDPDDFAVDQLDYTNLEDEDDQQTYTDILKGPHSGRKDLDFYSASDPESIYRVEAINHKLNDGREGYVTEISLLSPF